MEPVKKTIHVAAAVIRHRDRVFATQRGCGPWKDFWEFPGGKIEAGETPPEALRREIREELSAEIAVEQPLAEVYYEYPEFHLHMLCFWARVVEGSLTLSEHEAACWLDRSQLDSVNWLPADRSVLDRIRSCLPETDSGAGT